MNSGAIAPSPQRAPAGALGANEHQRKSRPLALSQQVRAVEEMLGVQLFDRAARPVKLTAAGEVSSRKPSERYRSPKGCSSARAPRPAESLGTIRLAYTFAIAYETLPVLLDAFAEDAPQVKVTSREMFGADMLASLREDNIRPRAHATPGARRRPGARGNPARTADRRPSRAPPSGASYRHRPRRAARRGLSRLAGRGVSGLQRGCCHGMPRRRFRAEGRRHQHRLNGLEQHRGRVRRGAARRVCRAAGASRDHAGEIELAPGSNHSRRALAAR